MITGLVSVQKIVSVNQKNIISKNGRVILSDEARNEMSAIWSSLRDSNLERGSLQSSPHTFRLTLRFYVAKLFGRRDTDNMIKIVQDCLTEYLGFNDAKIIDINASKRLLNKKSNVEFIYFQLEELPNFDHTIDLDSIVKLMKV